MGLNWNSPETTRWRERCSTSSCSRGGAALSSVLICGSCLTTASYVCALRERRSWLRRSARLPAFRCDDAATSIFCRLSSLWRASDVDHADGRVRFLSRVCVVPHLASPQGG